MKLYSDPSLRDCWAQTDWKHGVCTIDIHPGVLKQPRRLHAFLVHEFTHVVEYLNDPIHLDPKTEDNCTALAQTMEKQFAPLWWNLKLKRGRLALTRASSAAA